MRNKNTVSRQQKLINIRVASIRRAMHGDPFGGLFHGDSMTEMAYLMGADHALRWVKNENVYEPAAFKVRVDETPNATLTSGTLSEKENKDG